MEIMIKSTKLEKGDKMLSTGRDDGGLGQAVVQFIYLSTQDLLGENKNYI